MSGGRITACFDRLRQEGRPAFIPYLMAGDPAPEETVSLMHALVAGGADVIELGFPFSDPTADGPAIQAAGLRALQAGMTLARTLELCAQFRADDDTTPLVLMGYANPLLRYGYERFCADAQASGADGIIVVDLPPEEEGELTPHLKAHEIALVRLIAPTTQGERLTRLLGSAGGFVYAISIKGITGTHSADQAALSARLSEIRACTPLPVVAGFGIRTPEQAAALRNVADGVVVGSALVEALHSAHHSGIPLAPEAEAFARAMRGAE